MKHKQSLFFTHTLVFPCLFFLKKKGGDYISDGETIVLPLLHPETNDKMKGAEIVLRVAAGIKADVLQVKGKPMQASTFIIIFPLFYFSLSLYKHVLCCGVLLSLFAFIYVVIVCVLLLLHSFPSLSQTHTHSNRSRLVSNKYNTTSHYIYLFVYTYI
jgi:hypothetical protein